MPERDCVLNAYEVLQVQPHAPQDLIAEAYWLLASRASTRDRIAELNRAYTLLSDPASRTAYDEEHGFDRAAPVRMRTRVRGLGPFARRRIEPNYTNHYQLLGVDPKADSDVIDLGHAVMGQRFNRSSAEGRMAHQILEEAYHVLQHAQMRAQYDASLGIRAAAPADEAQHVPDVARPERSASPAEPPGTAPDVRTAADEPLPAVGDPPAASTEATIKDDVPARSRIRVPAFFAKRTAPPVNGDKPEPSQVDRPLKPDPSRRAGATPPPPPTADLLGARLRILRDPALTGLPEDLGVSALPANGRADLHAVHSPSVASLTFVNGPRRGARVPLGDHLVTLGSGPECDVVLSGGAEVALEHVRIWPLRDQYILRRVEGATMISGRIVDEPLVILEDGDDIIIGQHAIRFITSIEDPTPSSELTVARNGSGP